jgi:uncharacterized protein YbjT (DUF2867 family)
MNGQGVDGGEAKPTLVVGGSGKTGRRVAEKLSAAGYAVRLGSRQADPSFDWEREAGWAQVLDGVGAAYVAYYPDLAAPGAPGKIRAFVELALEMGVKRIVLLSGRGEEEARQCERALTESRADWTILRCSWFAQNFSEGYMIDGVLSGVLALPAGPVGEPFVDCDDIADAAVAALTEEGHVGRLYELTGPRLLTFREAADEIADALGRPVQFEHVPVADYAAAMREQQIPEETARLVTYLFDTVLDGRNAHIADGVQRALGRPPRDFRDYARATAASGVWNAPVTAGPA